MPAFTDQLNRQVILPGIPKRIVSLVPSQTELLYDLGLSDEVVGITKFCIHPQDWFRNKTRVGGTKQLNIGRIKELQPDLIIANKEENVKTQIEELEQVAPVWISDVDSVESALLMIRAVGDITGKINEANLLAAEIEQSFPPVNIQPIRCAYLIWKEPLMTIGGDTFIHDIMRYAGLVNVFGNRQRYPTLSLDDIRAANTDVLILPSEPFPFGKKEQEEMQKYLPGLQVCLADGEMFSWYGSRMKLAAPYLQQFVNRLKTSKANERLS